MTKFSLQQNYVIYILKYLYYSCYKQFENIQIYFKNMFYLKRKIHDF